MVDDELEATRKKVHRIVLGVIILIIAVICLKFLVTEKYYNNYLTSVIATMKEEQQSSGFISLSGDEKTRQTQLMIELLKIYGFTPSVEQHDDIDGTAVILSKDLYVKSTTIFDALKKMKIVDFHAGYDKKIPIVYGDNENPLTSDIRGMLDNIGKSYVYIDVMGEDPAVLGISARLYLSGYLQLEDLGNKDLKGPYLEYQGKMYPYPELLSVIKKMK